MGKKKKGFTYKNGYPSWKGCFEELRNRCYTRLHELYGQEVHPEIKKRLENELVAIGEKHAGIYRLCEDACRNMDIDWYIPEGGMCNSFVLYLLGVTAAVNPLPPHYRCMKCRYTEFISKRKLYSGLELPEKQCPICGKYLIRDGFNLADTSRYYQKGTVIPNFSFGITREAAWNSIKDYKEITSHDICIDSWANDWITHNQLSKIIDCLETICKSWYYDECFVKIDSKYHQTQNANNIIWNVKNDKEKKSILDFAFQFVINKNPTKADKKIINDIFNSIKPDSFSDMVRIYGLSSGDGTWTDNGKNFLDDGKSLSEIIIHREDLYESCLNQGLDEDDAYNITAMVSSGKKLPDHFIDLMVKSGFEQWYIDSCLRIRHLPYKGESIGYCRMMCLYKYKLQEELKRYEH